MLGVRGWAVGAHGADGGACFKAARHRNPEDSVSSVRVLVTKTACQLEKRPLLAVQEALKTKRKHQHTKQLST